MATDDNPVAPPAEGAPIAISPQLAAKLQSIGTVVGTEPSSLNNEPPPAETPPAVTPPAETPPADAPPAETPPAETPPAEAPPAEAPPADAPPAETPPAETPPAETPPVSEDPLSLEKEVAAMNSKITGEVKLEETPPAAAVPEQGFENWDDFEKFITGAGYEGVTKENASQKLTEALDNSKKHADSSSLLNNYNVLFENLPDDLMSGIRAWSNREDYRSAMNSAPVVDFTKGFNDHGSKEMVEKYFPGKITTEEWTEHGEADADPEIKAKVASWAELSEEKYKVDQQSFSQKKTAYETNAQQVLDQRQVAFDKSREHFPTAFEEASGFPVKDDYVSSVDKVAQSQQEVLGLFFNQDGSIKEDGHLRLAMAMDGKDFVVQQASALKNRLITQAREEVISNAPAETAIKKTGDQSALSDAEKSKVKVQKYVSSVLPQPDEKTY